MYYQQQNMFYPNQWGYGQPQQQPAVLNNFLTPEQIAEIQTLPQTFPTKLTKDEFMRSICTHKNNNRIMLEQTTNGEQRCALCGKTFFLYDTDTSDETIEAICKNMHDLIQSIKTYMLNAPEALKDIYMILGFIEKIPLLWKSSVKTFEQAFNSSAFGFQQNQNPDSFQMLGAIFGGMGVPGVPGAGFYGQGYGMPPQQGFAPQFQQGGYGMAQPNVAPPAMPQQQPAPQTPAFGAQTPQYGFTQPNYMNPTPTAPMAYGQNPIGYVEPTQGMAQTQITMTPMNPGQSMQVGNAQPAMQTPPPAPPVVNPNLQTPEKVEVSKQFAPASTPTA